MDFTPRTSGTYLLSVTLGVKRVHDNFGRFQVNKSIALSHIKGSPFLLNVQPGATDPKESTLIFADKIEGITGRGLLLELQAMDCNGNTRHEGGDKILAFVTQSPDGSMHNEHRNCLSEYAGGGRYSLKCPPMSESGSFQLNVHIIDDYGDLHPIKFSPFDVTIYPGNATPETTQVISGGIKTGTGSGGITMQFFSKAGLFGTFIVSLRFTKVCVPSFQGTH